MREHNTDGRYFTLEEAQGLVPWLSEKFSAIAPLREQANKLNAEIESLLERMRSNGGSEASGLLERRRRTLQETADQIEQQVRLIQQPGLIVKGIERALVDFPSIRKGAKCTCAGWRVSCRLVSGTRWTQDSRADSRCKRAVL